LIPTAVWILTAAVIAGAILASWHLRATDGAGRPPLFAAVAHGVAGAMGLFVLVVALQGPPRGVEAGAGSFGTTAAVLFGGSLLTGGSLLFLRPKGIVMAIHAGIAISGYVLLLAWSSLG
jgi:hypothetical protein